MVTIVGEKINTSSAAVRNAVEQRDPQFIQGLALGQAKKGADVIDVNVGIHPDLEPDAMRWAVELVQDVVDLPLALDSPNPETLLAGLQACREPQQAWLNSITAEQTRIDSVLPSVVEYGCRLVGLCMDERGVSRTSAERLQSAQRLVDEVCRWGISLDRLYLDALVEPISVEPRAALTSLDTVMAVGAALPGTQMIISLSAISFGLPSRRLLNRSFLPLLLHAGINAIILDPLDVSTMAMLRATQALLGADPHGLDFVSAYRSGLLGDSRKKAMP
jgi:5-methyltetrahydrofolate--homocysteine methyltransferase